MRRTASLCFIILAGCTDAEQYLIPGGDTPTPAGEGGFLDIAEDCPCIDLGVYEGISVFSDPGTSCPEGTVEGFTVHADLLQPAPHTCSACTCPPSTCALPQGMHTHAAKCSDADGSPSLPFGPANLVEDTCSSEGALPAGLDCDGVDCVQSLTVPEIEVSCEPSVASPSLPPAEWGRALRECRATAEPTCPAGKVCQPFALEGALVCLYRHGLHLKCPAGYDRQIVYKSVKDTRACAECTCSPPAGAVCDAIVTVHSDAACGDLTAAVMMSLGEPGCVDLLSGSGLGSSEASFVAQAPGACVAGGGQPIGQLEPTGPVTMCCKPGTVLQ